VLKGVEDILLLLEDMGLNLQSMMASPHVRPFADEVRAWELRLSLIGECIEVSSKDFRSQFQSLGGVVLLLTSHTYLQLMQSFITNALCHVMFCGQVWLLVQRKWMYLESIFIGSDDIRNQLPQEAKRFDVIDKAWLKIMADTAKSTNVLDACSTDGR